MPFGNVTDSVTYSLALSASEAKATLCGGEYMNALEDQKLSGGNIISLHGVGAEPDLAQVKIRMLILQHNVENALQRVERAVEQGTRPDVSELIELITSATQSVRRILPQKNLRNRTIPAVSPTVQR